MIMLKSRFSLLPVVLFIQKWITHIYISRINVLSNIMTLELKVLKNIYRNNLMNHDLVTKDNCITSFWTSCKYEMKLRDVNINDILCGWAITLASFVIQTASSYPWVDARFHLHGYRWLVECSGEWKSFLNETWQNNVWGLAWVICSSCPERDIAVEFWREENNVYGWHLQNRTTQNNLDG